MWKRILKMVDFNEFAKDFKEYLQSLGFISMATDGQTNYFYGKDDLFCVSYEYKSVWYRESNTAQWSVLNDIPPLYVPYLKQIAVKSVKAYKQNNIKKAIEEINKDFE